MVEPAYPPGTFYLPCSKCGVLLEVAQQAVVNHALLNPRTPLTVEHADCTPELDAPVEPEVPRRFAIAVRVAELPGPGDVAYETLGIDEEKIKDAVRWPAPNLTGAFVGRPIEILVGGGTIVYARNVAEAINGPLTKWLNETWPRMQETAAFADLPAATPPA